ncbi:type III-A CRISPR-associated protein Cas10/Csm1 [Microcoleus asticus]|uniref:CRISPR system single-strand-specific deoxyribonuclease Cas10/Csm1 (subtype III-A) n=1 Tax=Microcoleus asticus IPMA8 TaxID=2563858 RepID=A0ABX2D1W3_9CYAN|nr:type III-A CRISPR-associated protein Cas10/Csm1 [Microcoleus asticus]NQE36640.1 CRISPR-associated protein Cas10/Csm1 [Microcoleus asticus IPMA8]
MTSQEVALQVIQQAICALADWAEAMLPDGCLFFNEHPAVTKAKELLLWEKLKISYLALLFDDVKFPDSKHRDFKSHYYPAVAIDASDNSYPSIPYPLTNPPDLEKYKENVKRELENLREQDWQNLSLLTLILEKYASCLSFGERNIALIDMVRSTAAVASALVDNPDATDLGLIAGDLSGIQKFIYTIASDGALKSLRARSFYLELVTEEIVQQLLEELKLPRTNVIYAGGGNLYLLASATQDTKLVLNKVQKEFNKWLLGNFQGKVFLALDYTTFPVIDVNQKNFANHWSTVTKKLTPQKSRKFADEINYLIRRRRSYDKCQVCHRDDVKKLEKLNTERPDSVQACSTCRRMFRLGGKLFKVEAIVRQEKKHPPQQKVSSAFRISFPKAYYYLLPERGQINEVKGEKNVFFINNWNIQEYRDAETQNIVALLLGNYGQLSQEESGFIRAGEMAEKAKGISRVGYLRMDVDRLGRIFAEGLAENQTLPRLAGLSRQMSYFFKVYLNSLAENRLANLPDRVLVLNKEVRQNLLFIYAGGDDLFVSGAWNEIVDFAFDVYQSFRAYTGNNPDITLSGGISIEKEKFPLYQAAKLAEKAEDAAKDNGRDSFGLFDDKVFKWSEWLGARDIKLADIEEIDSKTQEHLGTEGTLSLFGILPFVEKFLAQLEESYSRSFVRNLLLTSQMQEQMIEEIQTKRRKVDYENEEKDIQYYLHLPQIAYTIARLPEDVRKSDEFKPVRKSLMSPYNAPYFGAIATWIELLNRAKNDDKLT